jgi:hypothetical protein
MSSRLKKLTFYFIVITFLNVLAFYPSFFDPPRSDQLVYLGNVAHLKDWYSLAIKNYDYNRAPQIYGEPGDKLLFRPFLYFVLGNETWAFGYHFLYWQLFSFILHLIIVWLLLKLLLKINEGPAAFFITAFFSLMSANSEMVTWHHLSSYLISIICILIVLNKIQSLASDREIPGNTVVYVSIIMAIATFTYETCAPISLLFALYIARRGLKGNAQGLKHGILIALPTLLYVLTSVLNISLKYLRDVSHTIPTQNFQNLTHGLSQILPTSFWWLYTGLLPEHIKIFPYQRTMLLPYYAFANNGLINTSAAGILSFSIALGLIVLFLYFIKRGLASNPLKNLWHTAGLTFLIVMIYTVTISMGRLNSGELRFKLAENSYYGYFFWLFFLIACYQIFPFKYLRTITIPYSLKRIPFILLSCAIAINVLITLNTNAQRAQQTKLQQQLLADTMDLVNQHKSEADFSFGVSSTVRNFVYADWIVTIHPESKKGYVYLQLLYPDYYSDKNPKFIYTIDHGFISAWQKI